MCRSEKRRPETKGEDFSGARAVFAHFFKKIKKNTCILKEDMLQ